MSDMCACCTRVRCFVERWRSAIYGLTLPYIKIRVGNQERRALRGLRFETGLSSSLCSEVLDRGCIRVGVDVS